MKERVSAAGRTFTPLLRTGRTTDVAEADAEESDSEDEDVAEL